MKAATSETVSATLGHSALVAGLGAGIAGLVLVLLYVIFYYRGARLVVISGLLLTAMLLWAIISALGHTSVAPSFDLAGITGLIVSIGITVDSYIVYFERLKDETRSGRSVRTSVDRGFKSAWRTVWAADFVSLLAAIVLYLVAVGNVKGFAFFLGLSTIMDMAITWFYTRPLVILLGQSPRLQGSGAFSIATGLGAGPQTQAQACRWAPWPGVAVVSRRRDGRGSANGDGGDGGDGSSLDDVTEEEVEQFEEGVDTGSLDEDELVSLDDAARALLAKPRRGHGPIARLYRGETRFDFVGKRRIWFSISTLIIVLGIVSIVLRGGLNLGIEFKGGTEWTIAAPGVTQTRGDRRAQGHRGHQPDGRAARQREQADAQRPVGSQPTVPGPAERGQQERREGVDRPDRCPRAQHADDTPRPTTTAKPTTTTTAKAGAAAAADDNDDLAQQRHPHDAGATRSASPPSGRRGARPSPTRRSRR